MQLIKNTNTLVSVLSPHSGDLTNTGAAAQGGNSVCGSGSALQQTPRMAAPAHLPPAVCLSELLKAVGLSSSGAMKCGSAIPD